MNGFSFDPHEILAVYSRRYLLPDSVVTTCPGLAPIRTGDVVIFVPVLNPLALLTIPVSEPSLFCLNFESTGMLSVLAPPPPKKEIPPSFFGSAFLRAIVPERRAVVDELFLAALTVAGAFFTVGLAGGLGELPKKEKAGLGAGAGGATTLGAGTGFGLPKKEKGCGVGAALAFGAGVGAALGGAGAAFVEPPRNENGFGVGLGAGAGVTLGAGAGAGLLKNENIGAASLFAVDLGAGFGITLAAGLGAILAAGSGVGVGGAFGDCLGAGLLKKLKPTSLGADFGATFGAGVDTTFGVGLGAAFVSALRAPKKLKAGAGATFLGGSGALKTLERSISSSSPFDFFSGSLGAGVGTKDWKMLFGLGVGFGFGAGALRALNFSCLSSHSRACCRACSAAASSNCLRLAT